MFLRDKDCQHHLLFSIIQPCKTTMISNFRQCVFAVTGYKPSKMCKIEKKKLCVLPFFGTKHFKKHLILVYPFQEKNVYYNSCELNLKEVVLPIKIISDVLTTNWYFSTHTAAWNTHNSCSFTLRQVGCYPFSVSTHYP